MEQFRCRNRTQLVKMNDIQWVKFLLKKISFFELSKNRKENKTITTLPRESNFHARYNSSIPLRSQNDCMWRIKTYILKGLKWFLKKKCNIFKYLLEFTEVKLLHDAT